MDPEFPEIPSEPTQSPEIITTPLKGYHVSKLPGSKQKYVLLFLVILLLVGGGFVFVNAKKSAQQKALETIGDTTVETSAPTKTQSNSSDTPSNPTTTPTTPSTSVDTPTPPPPPANASKTVTISYTSNCFNPANVTINKNDTVKFANNSNRDFWPASNDHPFHTIYPEFDAKADIPPGSSYSFQFTKVGAWGYHDHDRSSCGGTITVN